MASTRNSTMGRLIIAASIISVVADSAPDGKVRFRSAIGTSRSAAPPLSEKEKGYQDHNCKFGMPQKEKAAEAVLGLTTVIVRETYVLEHSSECKTPYWVCERLRQSRSRLH